MFLAVWLLRWSDIIVKNNMDLRELRRRLITSIVIATPFAACFNVHFHDGFWGNFFFLMILFAVQDLVVAVMRI